MKFNKIIFSVCMIFVSEMCISFHGSKLASPALKLGKVAHRNLSENTIQKIYGQLTIKERVEFDREFTYQKYSDMNIQSNRLFGYIAGVIARPLCAFGLPSITMMVTHTPIDVLSTNEFIAGACTSYIAGSIVGNMIERVSYANADKKINENAELLKKTIAGINSTRVKQGEPEIK